MYSGNNKIKHKNLSGLLGGVCLETVYFLSELCGAAEVSSQASVPLHYTSCLHLHGISWYILLFSGKSCDKATKRLFHFHLSLVLIFKSHPQYADYVADLRWAPLVLVLMIYAGAQMGFNPIIKVLNSSPNPQL